MRRIPLLMKRLSKKKQLFYVNCIDYDGEFGDDEECQTYSERTSLTKCCHCTYHSGFDTNNIDCNKE